MARCAVPIVCRSVHAFGVLDVVVATGAIASAGLLWWSRRGRLPAPEDGVRRRTIAEVGDGRFRVRGRIVPRETAPSSVDGAACVYVLRGSVDPEQGIVRDVAYELVSFPFRIEDESGAIEIDPHTVIIDAPPLHGEAGLVVEQRLRAGEEVDVVGRFRTCARGCVPYRSDGPVLEPVPDPSDPPRVTPSREPVPMGMLESADATIARAAALGVFGASVVLAWLMG
jgi:hypothetical protein